MPTQMTAQDYLQRAGLLDFVDANAVSAHLATYAEILETTQAPQNVADLYRYRVPELGENGACSLPDQLADEPYDLARTLGGIQPETTLRLAGLKRLVEQAAADTSCGWLGIYQARTVDSGRALVKLAYHGKPSRAEFPLTPEFAEHSNNSTVGLSGRAKLIGNVATYLSQGGAYYTCDAEVQSEACLPIFGHEGEIIGIIDAEDNRTEFFVGDKLARIVAICLAAGGAFPA